MASEFTPEAPDRIAFVFAQADHRHASQVAAQVLPRLRHSRRAAVRDLVFAVEKLIEAGGVAIARAQAAEQGSAERIAEAIEGALSLR